jgi:hypothetical protein
MRYIKVLSSTNVDFWAKVQPLAVWSAIEPGLGITAASLATLRPLLRKSIQVVKSFASTYRSRTTTSMSDPNTSDTQQFQPNTPDTGLTTLIANSVPGQNFLLSATNQMSSFQSRDEKGFTFRFSTENPNHRLQP